MGKHTPFKYCRENWKNTNRSAVFSNVFLTFLCKGVTSAIFKQGRNEDDLKELLMFAHKKSVNMSKFSLIILIGISEFSKAWFLPNLSMSFFMFLMLTSEKGNVSFSQLLWITSMLGWSLYLKIALRVICIMFSGSESKYLDSLLYLKWNYLEFRTFLTQFLRFHPFHWYWFCLLCVICLTVNVSLISKIVCYQLRI